MFAVTVLSLYVRVFEFSIRLYVRSDSSLLCLIGNLVRFFVRPELKLSLPELEPKTRLTFKIGAFSCEEVKLLEPVSSFAFT